MCINIYTSLASAQRSSFIAKSNAKLDFSFPLVFIYILHIWLEITCLKPNPLLLSVYTYMHTLIQADTRACIYTRVQTSTCMCVYIHIHIHGKKPPCKDYQTRIFSTGWEKSMSPVLLPSLYQFTASQYCRLSLEGGLYINLWKV